MGNVLVSSFFFGEGGEAGRGGHKKTLSKFCLSVSSFLAAWRTRQVMERHELLLLLLTKGWDVQTLSALHHCLAAGLWTESVLIYLETEAHTDCSHIYTNLIVYEVWESGRGWGGGWRGIIAAEALRECPLKHLCVVRGGGEER